MSYILALAVALAGPAKAGDALFDNDEANAIAAELAASGTTVSRYFPSTVEVFFEVTHEGAAGTTDLWVYARCLGGEVSLQVAGGAARVDGEDVTVTLGEDGTTVRFADGQVAPLAEAATLAAAVAPAGSAEADRMRAATNAFVAGEGEGLARFASGLKKLSCAVFS